MRGMRLAIGLAGVVVLASACSQGMDAVGPGGLDASSLAGQWTLTMTPIEREGMSVTVGRSSLEPIDPDTLGQPRQNASPTVDVEISARGGGLSGCGVSMQNMPTECRLESGVLVIRMGGGNEPTMVASLNSGDREVLTGAVRLESPAIPGGGVDFGTARMVRKE